MFGPWLNRCWLCFPFHLEELVIILAPHFRQKDGFSFGELVYVRFLYDCSWRFFNSHSFEFKIACRTGGIFLPILGEWRRKGGKHESRERGGALKIPPVRILLFKLFRSQTHPQWPANHSVRKTVVITVHCGPNTSKVLEEILVWDLK